MEIKWSQIPIEGLEDYMISEDGNVFSKLSRKNMSLASIRGGYQSIKFHKINKCLKVHQMVAKAFIPNNDPTKQIVNHIDGNKLNNHVSNLEWVSLLQNNKHAIDSGLTKITNLPIALVRACLEILVVIVGWYLGGTVGIGTLIFAFGIGPCVAFGLFIVNKIFS